MLRRFLLVTWLSVMILAPTVVLAVDWIPIVPCGSVGQPPCTPCSLFAAVKNVSDLVLEGITGPVAAFLFVVAGGMMLIGADNPGMQKNARTLMTNTVLGVVIILLSWVGTNFLIKNIATGSVSDSWYKFTCPAFLASIQAGPTSPPPVPALAVVDTPTPVTASTATNADFAEVAKAHNARYPRGNSPALISLINCIYQDPIVKAMALPPPNLNSSGPQNTGVYTYDNDNEFCNYSRGEAIAGGVCSHGGSSCHTGGTKGTQGAEAVDINARLIPVSVPGTDDGKGNPLVVQANEDQLFCQLYRLLVVEKKCPIKLLNWESDHTHISTTTCDQDGRGGVSASKGTKIPDCGNSARFPAAQ